MPLHLFCGMAGLVEDLLPQPPRSSRGDTGGTAMGAGVQGEAEPEFQHPALRRAGMAHSKRHLRLAILLLSSPLCPLHPSYLPTSLPLLTACLLALRFICLCVRAWRVSSIYLAGWLCRVCRCGVQGFLLFAVCLSLSSSSRCGPVTLLLPPTAKHATSALAPLKSETASSPSPSRTAWAGAARVLTRGRKRFLRCLFPPPGLAFSSTPIHKSTIQHLKNAARNSY